MLSIREEGQSLMFSGMDFPACYFFARPSAVNFLTTHCVLFSISLSGFCLFLIQYGRKECTAGISDWKLGKESKNRIGIFWGHFSWLSIKRQADCLQIYEWPYWQYSESWKRLVSKFINLHLGPLFLYWNIPFRNKDIPYNFSLYSRAFLLELGSLQDYILCDS